MSKCNIECQAVGPGLRRWEITPEGIVWPCCYFATTWDKIIAEEFEWDDNIPVMQNDKTIMDAFDKDPNWNNLEHKDMHEIIEHELFQKYIYHEGWESDNPPPLCVLNCKSQKSAS